MESFKGFSESFVKKYSNKQAKFGYNGLGYTVYKRTYAREIPGENRKEEWHETIKRCIEGAQNIGADYTQEEAERLYDHLFNLKCSFAGRMLWQLNTPTVDRFGANSLLNCLSGETKVLTRQGWKEIKDLAGKEIEIVTKNGKWVKAPFKNYGKQNLVKVTFKDKFGSLTEVFCTKDHRWLILSRRDGQQEKKTHELKEGDEVPVVRGKNSSKELSPQGIQHGLVFGDGSCNGYESFIDLIDSTYDECKGYFSLNRIVTTIDTKHVRFGGMPNYYKSLPDINENKQYLSGFLAGWIAADGTVNKCRGDILLFNKDKKNLDFARDIASVLGYRTSEPYKTRDHNPFVSEEEESELWEIRFYKSDNPHHLLIRKDHLSKTECFDREYDNWKKVISVEDTDRFEDVFCCEVPETKSFVIEGNILTGNCWYCKMNDKKSFLFLFENLMLGGGVGFSIRREDVHELPRINKEVKIVHKNTKDADFIVPDSREGWVSLLEKVLDSFFESGKSFTYSTILIRGPGEKISGFGGVSSGPKILVTGIDNIVKIFQNREGKKLRSLDVLDICNLIGSIVVSGNVRRSAQIAIGDPDDILYLKAKRWDLGNVPHWRAMSNNSLYIDDYSQIMSQVWEGYRGNGEPYGLINIPLSQKYGRLKDGLMKNSDLYPTSEDNCDGYNPCAEISLGNYECCNLCELYLNNIESKEELIDCAKLLYKTQKAIASLPFIHKDTEKIVHKNMRLGLGVTGICQSLDKIKWLDECYVELRKFDKQWSKHKKYPCSIKLTTIKPSGTLSLLSGSTPGTHPAYSKYYIRRVRMASDDPLVNQCREAGYKVEYVRNFDGTENRGTVVVEFPCYSGETCILAKDMSAIKQLELVKKLQEEWSDNSVSVTVYYRKEEVEEIQEWLKNNYEKSIKSVSFLLHSEHGFDQAPYEEITESRYQELVSKIDLNKIINISSEDGLEGLECSSGVCPIK